MDIVSRLLDQEKDRLSEHATLCANSRGRQRREEDSPMRTAFQRDRDRIIHAKAFRRLIHKTQVFLSPDGDHYRTRLTHTLEVAQIARSITRALFLNEDLAEAISLGHDLGHTPFGHAGENALNAVHSEGFAHNEQSLRVVDRLEKNGEGLNLTYEVRNGILRHRGGVPAETPEGRVVFYADRIAYLNHDFDDAVRAGILSEGDFPDEVADILGNDHSRRINSLVLDIVISSDGADIRLSPPVEAAMSSLRQFMFERVYRDNAAKKEEAKTRDVIRLMYEYYYAHPHEMAGYSEEAEARDGVGQMVCDYIAGMTDRFALGEFKRIFIPRGWHVM